MSSHLWAHLESTIIDTIPTGFTYMYTRPSPGCKIEGLGHLLIWFSSDFLLVRGIEQTLRAFASMRAVRLFLQARAVINFLERGLKLDSPLYRRNISGRVTLLPGTEFRPVSFNKRQQNEEAFCRHIHGAHVSPMFPSFPYGKH